MPNPSKKKMGRFPPAQGLYDPAYEHDACGVGFVVNINGEKSHAIIERGGNVLINLLHRGAIGGDLKTGDGAGILFQIPDTLYRRHSRDLGFSLPDPGKYGVGMFSERAFRCHMSGMRGPKATGPDCAGTRLERHPFCPGLSYTTE